MTRTSTTAELTPGTLSPERIVPAQIARPEYVGKAGPSPWTGGDVHGDDTVTRMRAASRIAADALQYLETIIRPGITTDEVDAAAHAFLVERDAYPSTLGYRGFPKSCCTSLNEVVCHGIPDSTELIAGDILNVDITAYIDGVHGDTNRMYCVGGREAVSEDRRLLVERTHEAMMRGIRAAKPGRSVNVIGRVIETYAKRFGYGVIRDFTGHGVGPAFHTGLIIPHWDAPGHEDIIVPGMTFTIEPMLTLGGDYAWDEWDDNWTIVTRDRSATAQWEHTIVIHEDGTEILTLPSDGREPDALSGPSASAS